MCVKSSVIKKNSPNNYDKQQKLRTTIASYKYMGK